MKYRTDFVTNSSSSSSVIVKIKLKNGDTSNIEYSGENFGDDYFSDSETYASIITGLIRKLEYGLIVECVPYNGENHHKNDEPLPTMAEISGGMGLYIYKDNVDKYLKKGEIGKLSDNLEKILELEEVYKIKVKNYEEFCNHPFWSILGIMDPKKIKTIEEVFEASSDEGELKTKTKIDVAKLEIINKVRES